MLFFINLKYLNFIIFKKYKAGKLKYFNLNLFIPIFKFNY